jgi:type III secretion protein N (ATPase)
MFKTDFFSDALDKALTNVAPLVEKGRVHEVVGTVIKASGIQVSMGEIVELHSGVDRPPLMTEVVGFSKNYVLLTPFGSVTGLSSATEVIPTGRAHAVGVGNTLLGRILDGFGNPMDGKPPIQAEKYLPVYADPPDPLKRRLIEHHLPTGVRVIDGLMTIGEGQRMGIFAAAGVGKSTLMGMLARGAACDVNVIALIGERGREVREFMEDNLGPEGMARSVVVCATSDKSSIERAKAAYVATTIAEYFRDQGMSVLMMMDSLTRFARAQREIGLANGEPPTRRGYPPSIFAELPRLLERAGQGMHGAITAFYTVLAEGENSDDPIAEEVRSILDGHMILSRKIAAKNQYPAIDALNSLSRVMTMITSKQHRAAAGKMRNLMSKYNDIELLLQIGEFKSGGDPVADEAVSKIDEIKGFLCQATDELNQYEGIVQQLQAITEVY